MISYIFTWIGYLCAIRIFIGLFLILIRQLFITIKYYANHIWKKNAYETNLTDKYGSWAVITGATDGVGKAYAKELAKRRVNVVLISRTLEKLERVSAEIRHDFKVETKIIVADFSNASSILFQYIEKQLQNIPIGILVNNVAVMGDRPMYLDEMSDKYLWNTVNVNIATTLFMTRIVLPQMKKREKGAIINISSMAEIIPWPLFSPYAASKAFVRSFSYSLKNEYEKYGITVQLLSPGFLRTNLTKFSGWLHGANTFFVPDAETYAANAIKTLGNYYHTCGYLPHDILYWLLSLQSMNTRNFWSGALGRILRYEQEKTKREYIELNVPTTMTTEK